MESVWSKYEGRRCDNKPAYAANPRISGTDWPMRTLYLPRNVASTVTLCLPTVACLELRWKIARMRTSVWSNFLVLLLSIT